MYLHCLITYSCMHCREMLYGLCSLQTNLHISFHHQSDVLLQQATTFMKLLLSPKIRNAMEKVCQRYIWSQVNQTKLSTGPGHLMSLLGVRVSGGWQGCRALGAWGVHMKNKDGLLKSTLENCRWSIADNSTWAQVNETQVSTTLGHQMPLPGGIEGIWGWWVWQGTSDKTSSWPTGWWHVMLTCSSTTLDH